MTTVPKLLFPVKATFQLLKYPEDVVSDPVYGEPEESGDALYVQEIVYTGPSVCSGVVDGLNTTFTVSESEYVAGTLIPYVDGVEQVGFSETDPESGIFDLATAPEVGSEVTSKFQKTEDDTQPVELEIKCQWVPKQDNALMPVHGGDSQDSRGYVLVRTRDVEKVFKDYNGIIKKGDLLVSVGGESVNAVVAEVENHSHYGGRPQLKFIRYEDRQQGI